MVVLASASPARLAVLRAAGLDPEVLVADIDEERLLATLRGLRPADRVAALAAAKAAAVESAAAALGHGDRVVLLGCDSMLEIDGELLGKPHAPETARRRWRSMSGATGVLHTGHAVRLLQPDADRARSDAGWATAMATRSTTVRFATVTATEIADYVATGEPLAVAGAFTLDGYGGWFVDSIDGDPSNVLGISPAARPWPAHRARGSRHRALATPAALTRTVDAHSETAAITRSRYPVLACFSHPVRTV